MKRMSRESLGAGDWSFRSVNTPADLAKWNEFIAQ
jgi:molybdopterin-guanine dinucleotide biosynthesis protein A